MEPEAVEHHSGLDQLFVVLRHRGERRLARELAGLGILVRLHDHHEPHGVSPSGFGLPPGFRLGSATAVSPASTLTSNEGAMNRHAARAISAGWRKPLEKNERAITPQAVPRQARRRCVMKQSLGPPFTTAA